MRLETSSLASTRLSSIQALELLYNSTQGDQWRWKNEISAGPKWSFTSPQADPCNDQNRVWQGITCSSLPNVCQSQLCEIESLFLSACNLNGTLPSQFFFQLPTLISLEISASQGLIGSIPSDIGSLSQLEHLSLSMNQLTGTIPSEINSLSSLSSLHLYNNQLTGSIPTVIGSLSLLDSILLYQNHLTQTIPSEVGSLSQLITFSLSKNQFTGTLPTEIGSLSQLVYLYLHDNLLTNSIPSEICSISTLQDITLSMNQLTGTIPPEIGSFSQLSYLSLDNNQLTGSIPSEISSLSHLVYGYFQNNKLFGTIPTEIGNLSQLVSLYLHLNQLTGSIPSEIGSLSQLGFLYLYENLLSGSLPSQINSLSQLVSLYLHQNQLTQSIPPEICSLSQLVSLYLQNNQLTGTIPFEIGSLSQLVFIYLDQNQLTGFIPSEFGSLVKLDSFSLANNQLTGTIPSSISNLHSLVTFQVHHNHLKGRINFQLSSYPSLEQLFLQQNHLTGSLHLLFSSSNSSLPTSALLNLDLSDNLFSGSIPPPLFIPRLQSLSLSLNCFEQTLPHTICNATGAFVMSMDGLGSAKACKNVITLPLTSVSLVQSMDGGIPDCLWMLSNLKVLSLAGNGLQGKISSISLMTSLHSLTLSHNYLSGEIPVWLQVKNMYHLDLSHNKITGDATRFMHQGDFNDSLIYSMNEISGETLALNVNRLSGDLPVSFGNVENLDILSGNLFSCGNLPSNDKNSGSVSCGSEQYNQTLILMGCVIGLLGCLIGIVHLFSLLSFNKLLRYSRYYLFLFNSKEKINSTSLPAQFGSTISFGFLLYHLMQTVCVLMALCVFLSLPLYVLKQLDVESGGHSEHTQYVTHSHMYNWLWTMAFVSGTTPAIIVLVMGFICLLYFNCMMNQLGGNVESSPSLSMGKKDNQCHFLRVTVWFVFFLNISVVGMMNGLYIWSTLIDMKTDVRIWIQVSFSFVSFLWSVVLRGGLPSHIKESRYGVWLFICLNVMNSVIIPCLVTALSTPSCFQVSPSSLSACFVLIFILQLEIACPT
jgi:Leucine-rich repeat (LRR) protein